MSGLVWSGLVCIVRLQWTGLEPNGMQWKDMYLICVAVWMCVCNVLYCQVEQNEVKETKVDGKQ